MSSEKFVNKIVLLVILPCLCLFIENLCMFFTRQINFSCYNEEFRNFEIEDGRIDSIENIKNVYLNRTMICDNSLVSNLAKRFLENILKNSGDLNVICDAISNDLVYFPVACYVNEDNSITYVNSWFSKRNFGGERVHEGTDIMAQNNIRGYYPIISATNGKVLNKGWLKLGGYRIGILSDNGLYIYYAHLNSYAEDIKIGDYIRAGQLLGYMGDTGYSDIPGTTGKFAVHLHFGIYVYDGDKQVSINPYYLLKYLEKSKIYYKFCK